MERPEYNKLYSFGSKQSPGLFMLINDREYKWYNNITNYKWLVAQIIDYENPSWNHTLKKIQTQININI